MPPQAPDGGRGNDRSPAPSATAQQETFGVTRVCMGSPHLLSERCGPLLSAGWPSCCRNPIAPWHAAYGSEMPVIGKTRARFLSLSWLRRLAPWRAVKCRSSSPSSVHQPNDRNRPSSKKLEPTSWAHAQDTAPAVDPGIKTLAPYFCKQGASWPACCIRQVVSSCRTVEPSVTSQNTSGDLDTCRTAERSVVNNSLENERYEWELGLNFASRKGAYI